MKNGKSLVAFLAGILLLFACSAVRAQTTQSYSYRSATFNWIAPSGTASTATWHTASANGCTSYPNGDDDYANVTFPGGFVFPFAGSNYSGTRILSNGQLEFGPLSGQHRDYRPLTPNSTLPLPMTTSTNSETVPGGCSKANPTGVLAAYWLDINVASGGTVRYELVGTAPSRKFVVTWNNVILFGNASTRFTFQIILNEDGTFIYQYTAGASTGDGALVGVQVSTTDYTQYARDEQFIDPTNGTAILWYPTNVAPPEIGQYRLDEPSWNGTTGEVLDTSGNGRHGVRVGTANTIANGKICRAGNIAANTTAGTFDAVDLNISPASQIGSAGSMTFWYKANSNWNGSGELVLFDATTVANRPFFLTKLNSGKLRFSLTDSAGKELSLESSPNSFNANAWVHIGVSWYLASGTSKTVMQLFINGVRVGFLRETSSGLLHSSLGSIYMGDNRSNLTPNNGSVRSANGVLDEVRIYAFDISDAQAKRDRDATRASCSTLHHFEISHVGTGNTCDPTAITITAHDLNHNLVPLTGTTINLSTSTGHGNWSKLTATGTLTDSGNGNASYVFNGESFITLGLTDTFAETVNINVSAGGLTENTGSFANHDPNLDLANTCQGVFNACDGGNMACKPLTARLLTKLAGSAIQLKIFRQTTAGLVDTAFTNKQATVDLVYSPGGAALDATTGCATDMVAIAGTSQTVTFTNGFGNNGGAVTVMSAAGNTTPYRNVRVRTAYQGRDSCTPDNFAIRPAAFSFSSSLNNRLTAAGAAGVKAVAGSSFAIVAGAGAGYDGTPVLDKAQVFSCMANPPTIPDPNDGTCPDAKDAASALAGSAFQAATAATGTSTVSDFTYADAGGFALKADAVKDTSWTAVDQGAKDCVPGSTSNTAVAHPVDAAYGNVVGCNIGHSQSGLFGRFYPDRFQMTAGSVTAACGDVFTYIDQPGLSAAVTIKAMNSLSTSTETTRYIAGTLNVMAVRQSAASANLMGSTMTPNFAVDAWSNGVLSATLTNGRYGQAARAPVAPITDLLFAFRITDPDSVAMANADFASGSAYCSSGCTHKGITASVAAKADATSNPYVTKPFRFGRLRLVSKYGPASSPLSLPVEAQYWTGNAFATNVLDSCTSLAPANISVTVASGTAPTVSSVSTMNAGFSRISLQSAAAVRARVCADIDNPVSVRDAACGVVTPANRPWLQGNWGAATYERDPGVEAIFGRYVNPAGAIFQRENY